MKTNFQRPLADVLIGMFLLTNGISCSADRSEMKSFTTAPSAYGILAEKSLDLIADFDLETWSTMLSDSVVYCFPDGGEQSGKN